MKKLLRIRKKRDDTHSSSAYRRTGSLHLDTALKERTFADMEKLTDGKLNSGYQEDVMPLNGLFAGKINKTPDLREGRISYSDDINGAKIENFFNYFTNGHIDTKESSSSKISGQNRFVFTETSFMGKNYNEEQRTVELFVETDDHKSQVILAGGRKQSKKGNNTKQGNTKRPKKNLSKIFKESQAVKKTHSFKRIVVPINYDDQNNSTVKRQNKVTSQNNAGLFSDGDKPRKLESKLQIVGGKMNRSISLPPVSSVVRASQYYEHSDGGKAELGAFEDILLEDNEALFMNNNNEVKDGDWMTFHKKTDVTSDRMPGGIIRDIEEQSTSQKSIISEKDRLHTELSEGFQNNGLPADRKMVHKEDATLNCQCPQRCPAEHSAGDSLWRNKGVQRTLKDFLDDDNNWQQIPTDSVPETVNRNRQIQVLAGELYEDDLLKTEDTDPDTHSIRMEASLKTESCTDEGTESFLCEEVDNCLENVNDVMEENILATKTVSTVGDEISSTVSKNNYSNSAGVSCNDLLPQTNKSPRDFELERGTCVEESDMSTDSIKPPVYPNSSQNTCKDDQENQESALNSQMHKVSASMDALVAGKKKQEDIEERSLIQKFEVEHIVQINNTRKYMVQENHGFGQISQYKETIVKYGHSEDEFSLIPSAISNDGLDLASKGVNNRVIVESCLIDNVELATTSFTADSSSRKGSSPARVNVNDIELFSETKDRDCESGFARESSDLVHPMSKHSHFLNKLSQMLKESAAKKPETHPAKKERRRRSRRKDQNKNIYEMVEKKAEAESKISKETQNKKKADEPCDCKDGKDDEKHVAMKPLDRKFIHQGAKEASENIRHDRERMKNELMREIKIIENQIKSEKWRKEEYSGLLLILSIIEADMPIQFFEMIEKSKTLKRVLQELIKFRKDLILYNMYTDVSDDAEVESI